MTLNPFLAIFEVIPGWLYAAALALVLAYGGVLIVERNVARTHVFELKAQIATDKAERERTARIDAEAVAQAQFRHAELTQGNSNESAKRAIVRTVVDRNLADDNQRLHSIVAAYANSGGQEAATDATACRRDDDRPSRLGELVDEALELSRESEGFIRQRDDEVKRLREQIDADRRAVKESAP